MARKGRLTLYITISALLVVLLIALRLIFHTPYASGLPADQEAGSLPAAAMDQVSKHRTKAKRIPSAENLGRLGMVYHANARYEEAATCYELAIRRDGAAWIWKYYLGYLYLEMGQSDRVLEQFNGVIEVNPEAHHAFYYAGEASINLGQAEQAEEFFEKIKEVKKERTAGQSSSRKDHYAMGVYASYQLCGIYLNSGRTELAEQTLGRIISDNRNYGPAYRLLGNLYRLRGDNSSAESLSAIANDLMVYTPPVDTLVDELALLSRSESYLLKMIDEAINSIYSDWAYQLVENGVACMPGSKYLLSKAISVCLWVGKEEQAVSYASDHLNFSRNDYSELYDIGLLFSDKELYQVSKRYLQRALELKPDDYELMKRLASSSWHGGNQQVALDLLDRVISGHPDNLEVLAEVTDIMFFELGEQEKSLQYHSFLKQLLPSNPRVLKLSAWEAEQEGNINEAISKYEASFRGNPDDMATIRNLGALLSGQQMWGKAISHYRSAFSVHPDEPEILERLGTLLIVCPDLSLRDVQEGRIYAERAFIHTYGKPLTKVMAGRNLAMAYAMLGDKRNALTVINMTIKIARQARFRNELIVELEDFMKQFEKMGEQTGELTE